MMLTEGREPALDESVALVSINKKGTIPFSGLSQLLGVEVIWLTLG